MAGRSGLCCSRLQRQRGGLRVCWVEVPTSSTKFTADFPHQGLPFAPCQTLCKHISHLHLCSCWLLPELSHTYVSEFLYYQWRLIRKQKIPTPQKAPLPTCKFEVVINLKLPSLYQSGYMQTKCSPAQATAVFPWSFAYYLPLPARFPHSSLSVLIWLIFCIPLASTQYRLCFLIYVFTYFMQFSHLWKFWYPTVITYHWRTAYIIV